jgi:class 3 adenylate cyclase
MSWSRTLKNRQQIRARIEADNEIGVMFSDIRGFSSYTARQGDRAAYRLSKLHEELLEETIEEHGGIIAKTMGDGIMAAFSNSSQGIQTAAKLQQEIRSRNQQSPEDPIDVGIGLTCGTPIMTDADLIGHCVNLSQRLSSLAKGGQILVTERVRSSATLQKGLQYLSLGERELKGLGTQHIYEIAWLAEVSRLSDGEDRLTLVLTERGTVVIELAKQQVPDTHQGRERARNDQGARFGRLHRSLSHFTRRVMVPPLNTSDIAREHNLDQIEVFPIGKDVIVQLETKNLRLRRVDPAAASAFLTQLNESKKQHAKPPTASEGE